MTTETIVINNHESEEMTVIKVSQSLHSTYFIANESGDHIIGIQAFEAIYFTMPVTVMVNS